MLGNGVFRVRRVRVSLPVVGGRARQGRGQSGAICPAKYAFSWLKQKVYLGAERRDY